jgi:hypothetical protein
VERLHPLGVGDQVVAVAPVVAHGRPVLDLDDPRARDLEEVAIVRDEHERARERAEPSLEPLDRVRVEVIRRLVEEQEIRAAEECERERHPTPLPTRELCDDAVARHRADAGEDLVDLVVETPPHEVEPIVERGGQTLIVRDHRGLVRPNEIRCAKRAPGARTHRPCRPAVVVPGATRRCGLVRGPGHASEEAPARGPEAASTSRSR